jgi:sec-independent protein translocase protein TatB
MLPGLGFSEILVLGVIALLVVGPKDLPVMLRELGRWSRKMQAMAAEFRQGFDELARQAELDELRKEVDEMRRAVQVPDLEAALTAPVIDGHATTVLDEPSALPAPADEAVTQPVETPAPQTMGDKVETR